MKLENRWERVRHAADTDVRRYSVDSRSYIWAVLMDGEIPIGSTLRNVWNGRKVKVLKGAVTHFLGYSDTHLTSFKYRNPVSASLSPWLGAPCLWHSGPSKYMMGEWMKGCVDEQVTRQLSKLSRVLTGQWWQGTQGHEQTGLMDASGPVHVVKSSFREPGRKA